MARLLGQAAREGGRGRLLVVAHLTPTRPTAAEVQAEERIFDSGALVSALEWMRGGAGGAGMGGRRWIGRWGSTDRGDGGRCHDRALRFVNDSHPVEIVIPGDA